MWVWRGVAPWTWPKARNTFLCFPKVKAQQEKIAINCMQLKKKKKLSQVK